MYTGYMGRETGGDGVGLVAGLILVLAVVALVFLATRTEQPTGEERQAEALAECLASGGTATTNSITYAVACTIEPKE